VILKPDPGVPQGTKENRQPRANLAMAGKSGTAGRPFLFERDKIPFGLIWLVAGHEFRPKPGLGLRRKDSRQSPMNEAIVWKIGTNVRE
jgi:hypothetical protein